jgi:hypothetical protein
MPSVHRHDDGTWHLVNPRRNPELGDSIHDEALARYLTAFDPAFTRAKEECEFEFILTLLRVRGVQDAGWDPFDSTRDAIAAVRRTGNKISRRPRNFVGARHLQLWLYGHIVEASEPYEILANLIDIAAGGQFIAWRFPDENGRPVAVGRKIRAIDEAAAAAGVQQVTNPLHEVYDRPLRNAVFHADYSLHGGEVRLPRDATRYTHEQIMERVNQALAYFDALTILFDTQIRSYDTPRRIPVSPTFAQGAREDATVISRRGHGLVGLKHSLTDAELNAGGITWRIGIFTGGEIARLNADQQLALLPERRKSRGHTFRQLTTAVGRRLGLS